MSEKENRPTQTDWMTFYSYRVDACPEVPGMLQGFQGVHPVTEPMEDEASVLAALRADYDEMNRSLEEVLTKSS